MPIPAVLSLCVLASCHDDPAPPSVADKLTAKRWTPDRAELALVGHTERLLWMEVEACYKDDVVTFAKDGTATFDAGADDCNGQEKAETGTWSLRDGDKILVVTKPSSDPEETGISFFDENTLMLTSRDTLCCFDTNGDQIGDTKGWFVFIYKSK